MLALLAHARLARLGRALDGRLAGAVEAQLGEHNLARVHVVVHCLACSE